MAESAIWLVGSRVLVAANPLCGARPFGVFERYDYGLELVEEFATLDEAVSLAIHVATTAPGAVRGWHQAQRAQNRGENEP